MSAPTHDELVELSMSLPMDWTAREAGLPCSLVGKLVADSVAAERERCAAIVRDEMLRKSNLSVFASLGEVLRCIEADR